MVDTREQARVEWERFKSALPELMRGEAAGRWVLFRDGSVQGAFDDEVSAYRAGLMRYGLRGGHIVACVESQTPLYASPAARMLA